MEESSWVAENDLTNFAIQYVIYTNYTCIRTYTYIIQDLSESEEEGISLHITQSLHAGSIRICSFSVPFRYFYLVIILHLTLVIFLQHCLLVVGSLFLINMAMDAA